ncbi:MAG: hypothetical protein AAF399_27450, partial [Bacteroidota bacterium]
MNVTTPMIARVGILLFGIWTGLGLYAQPLYELHWAASGDPNFSGSGGGALTQTLDTTCSMLGLSVTDTLNSPLGSFSPIIINPQLPGGGGDLTDLSGNMSFHVRVRSREAVTMGFLLRAGDGSSAFRTDRLETIVPGDTANWTELTFAFDATTIGGFDSTDLRDVWLYLDPGTDNFAGNQFYFDYFTIGAAPDSATFSTCPSGDSTVTYSILYETHWTSSANPTFGGSGGATLTQELDSACSMITLSVTDTANAPLPAFNAITINPQLPGGGGDLTDLSGNMSFHVRVRSRDS